MAYEGASRTGFRLGYFAILRSAEFEDELFHQLRKVTRAQVRERARELFRPEARVVVRYTPTGGDSDE